MRDCFHKLSTLAGQTWTCLLLTCYCLQAYGSNGQRLWTGTKTSQKINLWEVCTFLLIPCSSFTKLIDVDHNLPLGFGFGIWHAEILCLESSHSLHALHCKIWVEMTLVMNLVYQSTTSSMEAYVYYCCFRNLQTRDNQNSVISGREKMMI